MLHTHSKYIFNTHVMCVKITKITASPDISVTDDKEKQKETNLIFHFSFVNC